MKKIFQALGMLFIIGGIIFLLVHSFIVTGNSNESFARDILGFPIPHPPLWTSYVPYMGFFLGIIFEFFSIHGLVGIVIFGVFICVGGFLVSLSNQKEDKQARQQQRKPLLHKDERAEQLLTSLNEEMKKNVKTY